MGCHHDASHSPKRKASTTVNKLRNITLAAGMAALGTAGIAMAASFPGSQLSSQAKFSLAQARFIALHTVGGTIVSQELEKEHGGSGLRYSFDIKTAGVLREVGIDAKTGALLENSADNPTGADKAPGGESNEQGGGEASESDGG